MIFGAVLVVAVAAALGGCGGKLNRGDDSPDAQDLGCGTFRDSATSCGPGAYCFGPPSCDARWSCQPQTPCSAAPPSLACGCDGRIVELAAGCGERHAYAFMSVGFNTALPEAGSPCDPSRAAPFSARLAIRAAGFDGFDGARLHVRAPWFPAGGVEIAEGRVSYDSQEIPLEPGLTWHFEMLLDRDADRLCDPATELAWVSTPTSIDAVDFVVRFDLTPDSVASAAHRCDRW
jgi:hypothetical protein